MDTEPQQKQHDPAPTTRTVEYLKSGQATSEEIQSFGEEECRASIRMLATDRCGNYFLEKLCHHLDPHDVCIFLEELVIAPDLSKNAREVAGSKVVLEMASQLKVERQDPPDDIVEIFKVLQTKLCEPPCLTLLEAVVDALPAGDHSDRFIDAIIHSVPELCKRVGLVIEGDTIAPERQLSGYGYRLLKIINSFHTGQSSKFV
ncbi:hypothetical protein Pmar_PMAR007683 [Perkinsus marinus ATCC 50983]|uniref:PUM-HD domain-containing protein n=1 Tax=Perkinsus marinus (strain ATCC 50983 / TXsc) TaxID=423536 RepID=C5LMU6_PERM5|nr:hypothetical protein Pmar_PMAR007683 [Perkinsus marinus ATCC 50983]EER01987.1 hypothetical protein Pmar_PMAR007683 [Perkinsus marinus ATCC 50983]|eukprot:XP_002769269.1 hypothetical protein Pmar_PMAR007683 [Perkinsus marinus ATCC 50983]